MNNNNERLILSNLSSRIWDSKDFSNIINVSNGNIILNKNIEYKESEFLQVKKFIIHTKENFEK